MMMENLQVIGAGLAQQIDRVGPRQTGSPSQFLLDLSRASSTSQREPTN